MSKRSILVLGMLASAASLRCLSAQATNSATSGFPHAEIILANTSFIDIGPPFDFYSIYKLTSTDAGTEVEKIAVTPSAGSCLQPTTEVSHVHLQQTLDTLFDHKDACKIPEKALRREAKRCKHCLVFSGVHVVAKVTCGGKPRLIRYEVLDRDLFDANPGTPRATSSTMDLLSTLDKAFGGGSFDRPFFSLEPSTVHSLPNNDTLQELASGKYDNLFSGELMSQLYRESQLPQKVPLVAIEASSPLAPTSPTMPSYPPIARAAHVSGRVSLQIQVGPEGKVAYVKWLSGPMLFQRTSLDTARQWLFPPEASGQTQSVTLDFNLNCPEITTTSSAASR